MRWQRRVCPVLTLKASRTLSNINVKRNISWLQKFLSCSSLIVQVVSLKSVSCGGFVEFSTNQLGSFKQIFIADSLKEIKTF